MITIYYRNKYDRTPVKIGAETANRFDLCEGQTIENKQEQTAITAHEADVILREAETDPRLRAQIVGRVRDVIG